MQPGVKPKPTNLKLIEGIERKDRINENEPKPAGPSLESPPYLINEAKKIWNKYALVLKNLRIFKQTDELALATLCQEAGRYIELQEIINNKKNYIVSNVRHGEKPIPEMAMSRECLKQIRALMIEFGMTPSARSRISVSDNPDEEDPMKKILDGK